MSEEQTALFFDLITAKVKEERQKRKVSQLKLALILGHNSTSYVARIELRQVGATYNLTHLLLIADEFGMEINELLPSMEDLKEH